MVTATYGTLMFKGLQTGRTYAVDVYISDVVAASVTFDSGSGATTTSLSYWKAPENVLLYDASIATGPTVMTTIIMTADAAQIGGNRIRIANFLNSLSARPVLSIGFKQGTNVGAIQA